MAALPGPEPAPSDETTKAIIRGPAKLASSRIRHGQESSASRPAPVIPVPPETAQAPVAKPAPRLASEPTAQRMATAEREPTSPAPETADDFVREAQQAWMAGQDDAAISKAQSALKAEPTPAQSAQAYEIIATCSCAIGEADAAREAASHLGDTKRELVKAMCMKNGVTIE